jgi:transglutaminase-like putative cysteine protease
MSVWESARARGSQTGWGLICIGLALSGSLAHASTTAPGGSLYTFTGLPSWVKPTSADYGAPLPSDGAADGSWDLLLDRQYNVRVDGHDTYQHSAFKITSSGGVDEYSEINLDVDPTYQSLDIHSVKVIREGRVSDQLHTARITALPQETELREKIYNGGYNINVLLSDVRVGDVVDYEYTIHSREQIFPGQFSTRIPIGWSVPVHLERIRIVSPASRELYYGVSDRQKIPDSTVHGATREFEWRLHDVPGIAADDERPRWYTAWPYLQVTSSKTWTEVATQATRLFVVAEPPGHELLAVVADIRKGGGSPAQLTLRALQFVQDQVRYVSISIGPGAFRPTNPNTVLSRRFGDCKDKSLLLVTILRQLSIDADPVLVNSRIGRVLDGALPTPYSFDHAIVRVKIGQQLFWVDSTANEQFSPLSTDAMASYGWGLVLDPSTTSLANIPGPTPETAGKKSEVLIDMSNGMDKPAKLQITTSYLGRWANDQRQELANDNPRKRQSDYANYIAGYYPGAQLSAPLDISDDKIHNIVKVREYYDLPQTFTLKNGRKRFFLQADELYRYANNLKSSVRSSPLAIAYPADVQQTIRVILPGKWPQADDTVKIENPSFRYVSTVKYSDKGALAELSLDYKYRALTDVVELAALGEYLKDRHRLDDDLGYSIWPPAAAVPSSTRVVAFRPVVLASVPRWSISISLVLAFLIALRYGYRWDPRPKWSDPKWPVGLRGWLLVFVVLEVFLAAIWPFVLRNWAGSLDVNHWSRLSERVPDPFKSTVQPTLLSLAAVGIAVGAGFVLTAILFFKKRSSTPPLMILTSWAAVIWSSVLMIYLSACHLLDAHTTVWQRLWESRYDWIWAASYTAYFMLSKRVKATFVKRLPPTPSGKSSSLTGAVAQS